MPERYDDLAAELKRLRDWRHEVVTPSLWALTEQQKRQANLLDKTASTVDAMQDEHEFARRVAVELRTRRLRTLTRAEKGILFLVAIVPLADILLRLGERFG